MNAANQVCVTFYVVHVVRNARRVWTRPEAMSEAAAQAFAEGFNRSVRALTHNERAVVVRQEAVIELPDHILQ
jgi:hypothetical protein